jgi:GH15 family glucan-1,4-alpha-glucosidase
MTPLERAALDAEAEMASLLADAQLAMSLEDTSDLLWNVATDAINAYGRAKERASAVRLLADHHGGAYNAWAEQ